MDFVHCVSCMYVHLRLHQLIMISVSHQLTSLTVLRIFAFPVVM